MHNEKLKKVLCSFLAISISSAAFLFLNTTQVRADELDPGITEITEIEETDENTSDTQESEYILVSEETEDTVTDVSEDDTLPDEVSDIIDQDSSDETVIAEETTASEADEISIDSEDENFDSDLIDEDIIDTEDIEESDIETDEDAEIIVTDVGTLVEIEDYIPSSDNEIGFNLNDEDVESDLYAANSSASVQLTGLDAAVYNQLYSNISAVAAGTSRSAVFYISPDDLGLGDTYWSASDLGLSSLSSSGSITDEACDALVDAHLGNISLIAHKLLADCPFELYWFDKTQGIASGATRISAYRDTVTGEEYLKITGEVIVQFKVISCYADSSDYTSISTAAVSRANTARTNAQTIVNRYAGYSDIDKLNAYRTEICNAVSYDFAAANANVNGEAYQLLNVFDNNSSTNVVCEGYAKAFKYLCDKSTFKNNVSCILVGGYMDVVSDETGHMWNIVIINGNNYLVDLTNCDSGGVGEPDLLFLKNPTSGNVSSGYTYVTNGYSSKYIYDSDTLSVFPTSTLTITNHGWIKGSTGWWYRNIDGTYPKSKWQAIDGKWYYFNGTGIMQTGWTKVGSSWFYLGTDGVMRTGWQKVDNSWYYFNSTGAMLQGWQKISGSWYYFDGLGKMLTSWQKIGGSWYYFDGLGKMQTGWKAIDGNWYYFDGLGKMQTGWKQIGGKWYFFNSLGAMLRNTTVNGYKLGTDGAMIG